MASNYGRYSEAAGNSLQFFWTKTQPGFPLDFKIQKTTNKNNKEEIVIPKTKIEEVLSK